MTEHRTAGGAVAADVALRRVAEYLRAQETYRGAARVHVALRPEGGAFEITEIYDAHGRRLGDPATHPDAEYDDFSEVCDAVRLAALTAGVRPEPDPACEDCGWSLTLPPPGRSALEAWRPVVERALAAADNAPDTPYLFEVWDERAGDAPSRPLAAGVLRLQPGADPDRVAALLREAAACLGAGGQVSVTVAPADHDGGSDWSTIGVAEPPWPQIAPGQRDDRTKEDA